MAKANKYPINNAPTLKDLLFGSKSEDGKDQNVPIESIILLLNAANGKDYIQYKFSPTDYGSVGSFTSNASNTNPSLITKLFFNKKSASKEDLTALFTKLDTLQNIVIELRNPSDSNNFATFKITNITSHTSYFEFDVVLYKSFSSGLLTSGATYSAYFDVKENFEDKLNQGNYVGTAETLKIDIETRVVKVEGSSLVPDTEITKLSHLNDTTDLQKPVSTAQQIAIDAAVQAQISDSTALLDPTIPIVPTGNVHILGVGPGTYSNWGGMVIPANNIGTLQRVGGVYSVSLTPVILTDYAKTDIVIDRQDIYAGVDLFTIIGFVVNSTRLVNPAPEFRCTDFISYSDSEPITAEGVFGVGSNTRQALFYSDKIDASYLDSWTVNDNETIILNSSTVPVGTKYVRFNSNYSYLISIPQNPKLTINSVTSNNDLNKRNLSDILDVENNLKTKLGVDLFTIVGYVHKTTGIPDTSSGFKHTDYLSLELIEEIKIENLGIGGAFRQATFFSSKSPSGIISSYTADDASTIILNKSNIPSTAKYVIFNTYSTKTPIISLDKKNYKAAPPVNTLLGKASWEYIDSTSGYSISWGQYWDGTHFVDGGVNYFNSQLYAVDTLDGVGAIHVKGWFYGVMPIVVFFQDQSLTLHVANGIKNGTNVATYYDFYEDVPAGANYAVVQQSRTGHVSPFMEMAEETTTIEEKKKVILVGDSETQMAYYADELMGHIKELDPSYDIYNYGVGGEKTNEIASRVGAFQMFLEPENSFLSTDSQTGRKYFTLPSTTSTVDIGANAITNSWNGQKLNLLRQDTPILDCQPNKMFINGIECLLTWTGSTYTLNRVTAGASSYKVFYGTQMTPVNSVIANENDIAIINIGQNGGWTNTADLVAQYKRVVESLGTKKYIVISTHYAQNGDSGAVDFVDNRSIQEAALKKEFGAKFINMREYLCSTALYDALETTYWNNDSYPTDTVGETHPTATDTSYMTQGLYAPMWWVNPNNSADIIHISRRTYAIYYKHIFKIMKSLKYFE